MCGGSDLVGLFRLASENVTRRKMAISAAGIQRDRWSRVRNFMTRERDSSAVQETYPRPHELLLFLHAFMPLFVYRRRHEGSIAARGSKPAPWKPVEGI